VKIDAAWSDGHIGVGVRGVYCTCIASVYVNLFSANDWEANITEKNVLLTGA
jgi:hypothetical protein